MSAGGPPANPLTTRAVELLEDGEWRELESVLSLTGRLVPPGRAVRRAELDRKNASEGAPEERVRAAPPERLVRSGQRALARDALHAAGSSFEYRTDEGGVRWVRLVSVPPRVARDRARGLAKSGDPGELADALAAGAPARVLLGALSPTSLMDVAVELARRERERRG